MSQRDRGEKNNDKSPEELTDEAIIEWLAREPQQAGSREFREKVMQEIRQRQPNVHRKAFCPSSHQSRLGAAFARLRPSAPVIVAIALALGFAAGFVTATAFGSHTPTSGPVAVDRADRSLQKRRTRPGIAEAGIAAFPTLSRLD